MPAQHAAIGGSAISRILRCPGSVKLVAALPREPSSPAAARGTMMHAAMVELVTNKRTVESLMNDGYAHGGVALTHNDARDLMKALHATRKFTGRAHLSLEVRVAIQPRVWGTADVMAYKAGRGLLADYKFGSGIVEVEDNEQLMFYAVGALANGAFPRTTRDVLTAIIQPAAPRVLNTHAYTIRRLNEFKDDIVAVAKVALHPTIRAPLIPGTVQCKWCPVKPTCSALKIVVPGGTLADSLKMLAFKS